MVSLLFQSKLKDWFLLKYDIFITVIILEDNETIDDKTTIEFLEDIEDDDNMSVEVLEDIEDMDDNSSVQMSPDSSKYTG